MFTQPHPKSQNSEDLLRLQDSLRRLRAENIVGLAEAMLMGGDLSSWLNEEVSSLAQAQFAEVTRRCDAIGLRLDIATLRCSLLSLGGRWSHYPSTPESTKAGLVSALWFANFCPVLWLCHSPETAIEQLTDLTADATDFFVRLAPPGEPFQSLEPSRVYIGTLLEASGHYLQSIEEHQAPPFLSCHLHIDSGDWVAKALNEAVYSAHTEIIDTPHHRWEILVTQWLSEPFKQHYEMDVPGRSALLTEYAYQQIESMFDESTQGPLKARAYHSDHIALTDYLAHQGHRHPSAPDSIGCSPLAPVWNEDGFQVTQVNYPLRHFLTLAQFATVTGTLPAHHYETDWVQWCFGHGLMIHGLTQGAEPDPANSTKPSLRARFADALTRMQQTPTHHRIFDAIRSQQQHVYELYRQIAQDPSRLFKKHCYLACAWIEAKETEYSYTPKGLSVLLGANPSQHDARSEGWGTEPEGWEAQHDRRQRHLWENYSQQMGQEFVQSRYSELMTSTLSELWKRHLSYAHPLLVQAFLDSMMGIKTRYETEGALHQHFKALQTELWVQTLSIFHQGIQSHLSQKAHQVNQNKNKII